MTSRISSTPLTDKKEKLKAAMYRSKCRWIEGRKTKYFSRKKTNYMYTKKVSMELEDENGGMATDEKQILGKIEVFYNELYAPKMNGGQLTLSTQTEGPLTLKNARQFLICLTMENRQGKIGLQSSTRRKTSWSKDENQQQTPPKYDAGMGSRTGPHWWEPSALTTAPSLLLIIKCESELHSRKETIINITTTLSHNLDPKKKKLATNNDV